MSKLMRSELKAIVKECLVEILSEGLSSGNAINETMQNSPFQKIEPMHTRKSKHLDNIVYNKSIEKKKKNIRRNVMNSNITSDPVLNELLADTATLTLQEQASAERRKGANISIAGDNAAKLAAASDPADLFSESAGKWAQLAFSK